MTQAIPNVQQAGLDLRPEPLKRKIAYYDEEYGKTLATILDGVVSKEDLVINNQGVWEAVGESTLLSATNTFALRNFTNNFHSYRIVVTNITSSTGAGLSLVLSKDNGETWITTGTNYYYSNSYFVAPFPVSSALAVVGTSGANLIATRIGLHPTTTTAVLDIIVQYPMNPNYYTQVYLTGMDGNNGGNLGDYSYEQTRGVYGVAEAHNAIGLRTASGTISGGQVFVWGQIANSG